MTSVEKIIPWYKQFWPWFLFALPASVVVAGITTVIIAVNHADSLVADNYYKQGLAINQVLAQDETAARLGVEAEVIVDKLIGEVRIVLTGLQSQQPRTLELKWIHPTNNQRDFSVSLNQTPDRQYLGQLTQAIEGRWYLHLLAQEPRPWLVRTEVNLVEIHSDKPASNAGTSYQFFMGQSRRNDG
jgi:hypothetical protein